MSAGPGLRLTLPEPSVACFLALFFSADFVVARRSENRRLGAGTSRTWSWMRSLVLRSSSTAAWWPLVHGMPLMVRMCSPLETSALSRLFGAKSMTLTPLILESGGPSCTPSFASGDGFRMLTTRVAILS